MLNDDMFTTYIHGQSDDFGSFTQLCSFLSCINIRSRPNQKYSMANGTYEDFRTGPHHILAN